jgi:hypothetical protein
VHFLQCHPDLEYKILHTSQVMKKFPFILVYSNDVSIFHFNACRFIHFNVVAGVSEDRFEIELIDVFILVLEQRRIRTLCRFVYNTFLC